MSTVSTLYKGRQKASEQRHLHKTNTKMSRQCTIQQRTSIKLLDKVKLKLQMTFSRGRLPRYLRPKYVVALHNNVCSATAQRPLFPPYSLSDTRRRCRCSHMRTPAGWLGTPQLVSRCRSGDICGVCRRFS